MSFTFRPPQSNPSRSIQSSREFRSWPRGKSPRRTGLLRKRQEIRLQYVSRQCQRRQSHPWLSRPTSSWQTVELKADKQSAWLTSRLEFYRHPDWMAQFPFANTMEITQRLHDGVLEVTTKIENLSTDPMPVAIGFHPYVRLTDSKREDWTISVGAKSHYLLQPNKIPTGQTEPITNNSRIPPPRPQADSTWMTVLENSRGTARASDLLVSGQKAARHCRSRPQHTRPSSSIRPTRKMLAPRPAPPGRLGSQLHLLRAHGFDNGCDESRIQRQTDRTANRSRPEEHGKELLDYSKRILSWHRQELQLNADGFSGTMNIDLSGKTAVITGASRGLGEAMARGLSGSGAKIALIARDRKRLESVRDSIRSTGGTAEVFTADVTQRKSGRGRRRGGQGCVWQPADPDQ